MRVDEEGMEAEKEEDRYPPHWSSVWPQHAGEHIVSLSPRRHLDVSIFPPHPLT